MSVVAFISANGGAGVTTSLVALAAHWPTEDAIVCELNRRGGDLAAWCGIADNLGTASLAAARWDGSPEGLDIAEAGALSIGMATLCGPSRQGPASAVVDQIAPRIVACFARSEQTVLIDAGALDANDLPAWLGDLDAVVVVTRQDERSPAITAARLDRNAELIDATRALGAETIVMSVGQRPFNSSEVAAFFDLTTFALASDPVGAAMLANPASTRRSIGRCALVRSARIPAARLTSMCNAYPIQAR